MLSLQKERFRLELTANGITWLVKVQVSEDTHTHSINLSVPQTVSVVRLKQCWRIAGSRETCLESSPPLLLGLPGCLNFQFIFSAFGARPISPSLALQHLKAPCSVALLNTRAGGISGQFKHSSKKAPSPSEKFWLTPCLPFSLLFV